VRRPRRALWILENTKRRRRFALPAQSKMIEVINHQRRRRINAKHWREFGEKALNAIGAKQQNATIVFVSDDAIRKLNRQFRGRNYATDVLSFPSQAESFEADEKANLGEVIISVQRAETQAKANGLNFSNEVEQLILHGLLHLCGYDHETDKGEMNRLELKLRRKLGI
jgi:probable rRNA maturation factor